MTKATTPTVELDGLVSLFYASRRELGDFTLVDGQRCPVVYGELLDHEQHMTVTVERRHAALVDVEVLEYRQSPTHYMRKIVLRRRGDRRAVLFGIVRLALKPLHPGVRDEILSRRTPVGRVLIEHNVLRQVQLNSLWRVRCGAELAELFDAPRDCVTFGRTALIYCDGEPAVELLEIVAPEDE